jgi:hypothetical protein
MKRRCKMSARAEFAAAELEIITSALYRMSRSVIFDVMAHSATSDLLQHFTSVFVTPSLKE